MQCPTMKPRKLARHAVSDDETFLYVVQIGHYDDDDDDDDDYESDDHDGNDDDDNDDDDG